jgi:hypothetical protein
LNDSDHDLDDVIPHFHVVAFINGCLNDYDSGPIESEELARESLREYVATEATYTEDEIVQVDVDRYQRGPYTITIEPCNNPCDMDD